MMLQKTSRLLVVAALLISAAVYIKAQTKAQTEFGLKEDVRKEAAIPEDVIAILKSDARVDVCFQKKGESIEESKWFAASEFDLNDDRRPDLIITAKDDCLRSASTEPFWIFRKMPDGYLQILSTGGRRLEILPAKTNSFNQIKISKIAGAKTVSEIFRYDGKKYQLVNLSNKKRKNK